MHGKQKYCQCTISLGHGSGGCSPLSRSSAAKDIRWQYRSVNTSAIRRQTMALSILMVEELLLFDADAMRSEAIHSHALAARMA